MNVAAILKQKGRAVTTARPTVTLMEVANKLVLRYAASSARQRSCWPSCTE
jgi:hypothetical protein